MAYSHEHRFKRRYGIHYTYKLGLDEVSKISGIELSVLKPLYDEEYARTKRNSLAMLYVFSYCNKGRVFKEKTSVKNTNE